MSKKSDSRVASAFSIEQALNIDEEGFTDKRCRSCGMRLSLDEISVFLMPKGGKGTLSKPELEKALKKDIICLSCYAV